MAKTKAEKITSIEEEIRQLENRRRQLVQEQKAQERKDRTKRLCRRMGLFESLVPDTIPLTEEQFKTFLEKTVMTDHARRILDGLTAQNAPTAPAQGAETAAQGNTPPAAKTAHTAREGGGNPHAHIMLTMRPFDERGAWGAKQKKEYILDRDGNKIYDPKKRQYKCKSVPATDWNEQTKAEEWRAAWAGLCNQALEQNGHGSRIDHRSYERQRESGNLAADQIPTVHLGVAASAMEKRGIRTERGDLNREIEVTNQSLRQLKARISKLQKWLKEEQENTEPPTLADYIQGILSRRAREGKSQVSQSIYNLKDAAKMLNFLQANNIMDMAGLDEKFKSMIGEQLDIQGKLKPVERRLGTLKKHLEQADIYFKYKGKKPLTEAEQILFTTAKDYLKGVMNGKTTIPTKTWKEEYTKLPAALFWSFNRPINWKIIAA